MADAGLSYQILEAVKDLAKDDPITREFLVSMLLEEHAHPGQSWWFKELYRKAIRQCSPNWSAEQ